MSELDVERVLTRIFNKYASENSATGSMHLSPADFTALLNSKDLKQEERVHYLSQITSLMPIDVMHLLYVMADSNKKGFVDESDFKKLTKDLILADDTNIDRVLFKICKFYDSHGSNNHHEDFTSPISKSHLENVLKDIHSLDYPYLHNLLNSIDSNFIDLDNFSMLLKELPAIRFKDLFQNEAASQNGVISPHQLKSLARSMFYDHLPLSIESQLEDFVKIKYGEKVNYQQSVELMKLISNLPKLNHLIFEWINDPTLINDVGKDDNINIDKFFKYTSSSNSPILNDFSKKDLKLFMNWNWLSVENLKSNPMLSSDDLLAIFTDDMVIPETTTKTSSTLPLFNSLYSFMLGSVAGAFGAFVVYPIDLLKTRMQNQRNSSKLVYNGYFDCFKKIIKMEGGRGMYSGLLPQLIGVAPEKAIKLTVNDVVRSFGSKYSKNGQLSIGWEILAGSTAGTCQVCVTNPLEITKIRLQTQGQIIKQALTEGKIIAEKSAFTIVNELGIRGLYHGAGACLLRDIPFSSIYFPAYANIKKYMFGLDPLVAGKKSHLEPWELLMSGALAGMPAAYLTTPCDVIKTRLQVESVGAEIPYKNIKDAFTRIVKEEGFSALFKGGFARVCRSSPQFGFTLAAYELFQRVIPLKSFYDPDSKISKMNNGLKINPNYKRGGIIENAQIGMKNNSSKFVSASLDLNPSMVKMSNYYKRMEKEKDIK